MKADHTCHEGYCCHCRGLGIGPHELRTNAEHHWFCARTCLVVYIKRRFIEAGS